MPDIEKPSSEGSSLSTIFDGASDSPTKEESSEPIDKSESDSGEDSSPETDESEKDEDVKEEGSDDTTDKGETEEKKEEKPTDADKAKETEEEKKASSPDPYEKRWKDTVSWANQLNQQNRQFQQQLAEQAKQMEILKKQIADPEYDPKTDPANQGPSHEDVASTSLAVGKALASRNAAYEKYGQENVDGALGQFHQLFGQNSIVQQVVRESESPVMEALAVVQRYHFEEKYGKTPHAMYENIKKEVIDTHTKEIRKQILDEIAEGQKKKDKTVKGLSSSRGGSDLDRGNNAKPSITPLGSIFAA